MKKVLKCLFLAAIVMIAAPLLMVAQGTPAASDSTTVSIAQTVITALDSKWPVIAVIGTILFFLSEALSLIPSVKANGVFQLIGKIVSLFKPKA